MKKFLFTHALAAKKKINSLLAIFIACSFCGPIVANTVTIPDPESGISLMAQGTAYLPIAIHNSSSNLSCATHSVSQQLYYASELTENSVTPSTNTIQAITFYYEDGTCFDGDYARKLQVWMKKTTLNNFDTENNSNTPHMVDPGTKVFSGSVEIISNKNNGWDGQPYTITFDTPFEWDGSSNIIVTVQDTTGFKNLSATFGGVGNTDRTVATGHTSMFADAGKVRFLHKTCTTEVASAEKGWNITSLPTATANSSTNRGYVNKITFTFAAAAVPPSVPSDLAVSSVTANSATLAWSAVDGATSYDLQQSDDGTNWETLASTITGTSYTWSELSPESTQYVQIRAVNANGESDWSDAVTVTTDAIHSHNGIEFDKWSSTNSLPTSGNYYLANTISFGWENVNVTLTGDLNLCLNGKTADLGIYNIIVPDGKTLTIFDSEGGGKITSQFAGEVDYNISTGVITVQSGGTLILGEGAIENTFPANDEDGYKSIAIANAGTLKLSGAPVISSNEMDICLPATVPAKVITIESGKPLTNSTPYKVYKSSLGVITSGWANMGGGAPSAHFAASNSEQGIALVDGEAKLVKALSLSDSEDNSAKLGGENQNTPVVITISRSFTSASYNTICLPFTLSDEQLQEVFGAGYDLQSFQGADLDEETGETLLLEFSKVTSLSAGVPYLIKPSINVASPTFYGVTIPLGHSATPAAQTSTYIDFQGVYSPTNVGSGKNILFVGANNELYWNNNDSGELKGFRAFFTAKGDAAKAVRARIVQKDNTATGLENQMVNGKCENGKFLHDGQLYLMYEGKMYDVRGQRVR